MTRGLYEILCTVMVIMWLVLYLIQLDSIAQLELEVAELSQDQSSAAYKLNLCQGQVVAFNKAFDYHVVMSEPGLYPQIKEDIYMSKAKEK